MRRLWHDDAIVQDWDWLGENNALIIKLQVPRARSFSPLFPPSPLPLSPSPSISISLSLSMCGARVVNFGRSTYRAISGWALTSKPP